MRAEVAGLLLNAIVFAGSASAFDTRDPNNCNGIEWDDSRTLGVSEVVGASRVYFIKSPYDDEFKATACPSQSDDCRKESYLVEGDLVLVSKTRGNFTCVAYQSPLAAKQNWTVGWLPSVMLRPVAPTPSPNASDWVGDWRQPGGHIEISGGGGKLNVKGQMTLPTPAGDYQNGDFHAQVAPQNTLAFVDERTYGDNCHVRMQRVGRWLLVEDNSGCGGAGVTFTGLYRRED